MSLPPNQLTVIIHEHTDNPTCTCQWLQRNLRPWERRNCHRNSLPWLFYLQDSYLHTRGCLRQGHILRCGLDSFIHQAVTTWLPSNMQVIKVWSRLLACTNTSPFYIVKCPCAGSVKLRRVRCFNCIAIISKTISYHNKLKKASITRGENYTIKMIIWIPLKREKLLFPPLLALKPYLHSYTLCE